MLALAVLLAFAGQAAGAENASPAHALERLFAPGAVESEWFAPVFLSQVPADQVARIVCRLEAKHGPFQGVIESDHGFILRLARAEVPTQIALDREGRIIRLLFRPPVPTGGGIDDYVRAIAALPGRSSVLVVTNGRRQAAHAAEAPLAVGSALKLAVLRVLADRVAEGQLVWDQVVRLDPAWRSLPSGILQDWPAGTPLTIASLANLMISRSDNTATDALIHILGRKAIEAVSPRNTPFLTTWEAFLLKAAGNRDLRQAWIEGDEAARRKILERIADQPLPSVEALAPGVTSEIEWLFTAEKICGFLEATHDLPPFRINPGPANPRAWRSVAFKGGSEAGVLNLSTYLTAEDGTTHCVVATWNDDEALADESLLLPYRGLLRALSRP